MKKFFREHWPIGVFFTIVLLGGFNGIGIHFTVQELSPFWGAALRFGPAAVLMLLLMVIKKLPLPRGKAWLGAVLFGFFNFGGSYALIYYGLQTVQAGMGQVIMALVPVFTLLFAVAHRQETFRWRGLLGSLLAMVGIAFVFQEELHANIPLLSILAIVLGAIFIAEGNVVIKFFPHSDPITTNVVGLTVGTIFLFGLSLLKGEPLVLPVQTTTWAALIYLVIFGTSILFLLVLNLLKVWSASATAYIFVVLPFVSLAGSAWLANEKLSPILLVGAMLVIAGTLIGIQKSRKKTLAMVAPAGEEIPLIK
jgi:drug/metabolite transporter (DMT)-like permease